jgi:cation:H+ antiporter
MLILNFILFILSLAILIKCAGYTIKFASRISKVLHINEFVVSFFIIAIISVLPEATISIIAAFNGEPGLSLGTLLGSNIADLTLVIGIVALFSYKGIKVKSKILRNNIFYLILLLFPIILGFDGKYSRIDGLILVLVGTIFFIKIYKESNKFRKKFNSGQRKPFFKSFAFLIFSLVFLLLSSYLTVKYAVNFAQDIKLPTLLIGLTIVAFGTCLPELIFSIKAVRKNHHSLALGDILGTVMMDATIILGFVALIAPFNYNPLNIYVTGTAMFISGLLVILFMNSEKVLNKKEGVLLILVYIIYLFCEFIINALLN